MKRQVLLFATLFVLSMFAAQAVQAQQSLVVNVPFDFTAGSTTLPAGEYSILKSTIDTSLLTIQRADLSVSIIIPTMAAVSSDRQSESRLIFHRYGDRYFLSQVWSAGNSRGRVLSKSASEKEVATIAKNESQVTLVAKLSAPHK
jgi:hypothetical protein